MTKHLFAFIAAFMVGCVVALAARSVAHKPHASGADASTTPGYSPMVTNPIAPAASPTSPQVPASVPVGDAHADHPGASVAEPKTVNTVCAICGMDVDPDIAPATFQGKLVGFGCRMCPPKFAREPEVYGPAALENKVVAP